MNKERLTVVLDPEVRKKIKIKAAEKNITVSEIVEQYIKSMLEKEDLKEDIALFKIAGEREKTFNQKKPLSHDEVWS